ncbi:hypothetical protein T440DRAFT_466551 [Plenodomus tracheiphilus IPT5]|uniref:Uncharacterized protein n=1 Tax=Plenodomus tracheiphilus IPT5 TaxID=1408161 RepID=A0A6A7BE49_9PLEO|nr:hypothetical protein T440DRAFT_466551 [Plenodomus tracheiphilus IPT5]
MTTRQPLQPLPPPSANTANTRYARLTTQSTNGKMAMGEPAEEDVGSVSGLSSLENDADDFEKLMIQNARDERRLNEALNGRPQAFRKARTHPRVGLTMDNLERNNARDAGASGANVQVKFQSPPSSSGSARSDPAIHAPPSWGRKSRSNRNWMRTITYDEEQQRTPVAHEVPNGHYVEQYQQHTDGATTPNGMRRSVEDSPLSHKSSIHGTPRNDRSAEWDLTFELNEASMIASTPYIPRSTKLDDIRQREMESLREQREAAARQERLRESSPEQMRQRPSSSKSTNYEVNGTTATQTEQATQGAASPQKRVQRSNSWKSIGKSQPVTGTGKEESPVAMYKSAENIATVDHDVQASTQNNPPKRNPHRREDSQDLLRRLARASHTPSPGRTAASRPQTAPEKERSSSLQDMKPDADSDVPEVKPEAVEEETPPQKGVNGPMSATGKRTQQETTEEAPRGLRDIPELRPSPETEDIDATPMPVERSLLNPKTPVVTGAWVDTPGPRPLQKNPATSRPRSRSPIKRSPQKAKAVTEQITSTVEETLHTVAAQVVRPHLPTSALQALVREAKSSGGRATADFGDSTINSLEDLITEAPDAAVDEDTLQGLQLPTATPRNEAERQRQQELLHLHRMNDRLRAARTSIRDASRGMKRVEDQVEHVEEDAQGNKIQIIRRECPCATSSPHDFSLWRWSKSLIWQDHLKSLRASSNSNWRIWGGLTGLGIFLTLFLVWWLSEEIAWYVLCLLRHGI